MHLIHLYACDMCPSRFFEDEDEAMAHEATHFGLSAAEYGEWLRLRKEAARISYRRGQTKTPETDAAFDAAIGRLIAFEAAHGLEGKTQPIRV